MKIKKKDPFDYGEYIIEYRVDKNGYLQFLQKKILSVDEALDEASKLKDAMYYDVMIKRNIKN